MSKPEYVSQEPIRAEIMDIAASIEADIPSRITGANRVFIRAVLARAIMAAEKRGEEREREACAVVAEKRYTLDSVNKKPNGQPYAAGGFAIHAAAQIAAAIRNRTAS